MIRHDLLLNWYDREHRQLPWRASPGKAPNPYHVLLSEIMLQQTTVITVIGYFERFIEKWPTLADFAAASLDEIYHAWQGLGYYSRAKNLHKCAEEIQANHKGIIPSDPKILQSLAGIGPYTAAAIAAIAYDYPIIPVDGNIVRVFSRLLDLQTPLPPLQKEVRTIVEDYVPLNRSGDFAQALMDLGATICKPQKPNCEKCPLNSSCKVAFLEQASTLPRKKPKPLKPTLYGVVFWYETPSGKVWLRRRPDKGLLANLMEFPGLEWRREPYKTEEIESQKLQSSKWDILPKIVKHTFTHFHLELTVVKTIGSEIAGEVCVSPENLSNYALPTLMKKVMLQAWRK